MKKPFLNPFDNLYTPLENELQSKIFKEYTLNIITLKD